MWIWTRGVWRTVTHSILLGWIHFRISFISVLFWNYRLSLTLATFLLRSRRKRGFRLLCDCAADSTPRSCATFALGTFHSSYLTVFDPAALSNEYESNGLPLPFLLFPFSSSSLRRTVAGRMLRPPHQWLHPQKDPEAFTLTPPTDPPPPSLLPPHSSVLLHHHHLPRLPQPHLPQNLKTHRDWTWRTVCGHAAGTQLGSGTTFSLLRTNVSLFPIRTAAALLSGGLISHTSQFVQFPLDVHVASLYFSYIIYSHSRHTVSSVTPPPPHVS